MDKDFHKHHIRII